MKCIAPRCMALRDVGSMFCATHILAPAGQRGGWLSAEKRRRRMGGDVERLDASNITRRLWIGGKPPFDRDLPGVDVLVLCAQELQPDKLGFRGAVIRCPIPDSVLSTHELRRALITGREVAKQLVSGKRVLVTCAAGRNRSALVAGLALGLTYRLSATQVIELIRAKRHPECLYNPEFPKIIHRFIGDGTTVARER